MIQEALVEGLLARLQVILHSASAETSGCCTNGLPQRPWIHSQHEKRGREQAQNQTTHLEHYIAGDLYH